MGGTRRLEERLADLEGLNRTAAKLRADLAPGDVGGDRARMPMRTGKSAGSVEHAYDRHTLTRHVRQRVGADRLDGVERRAGGLAAGTQRRDDGRNGVHR